MEGSSSWEKLIEKELRSRIIHPEYLPREPDESSKRHLQTCIVVMALVLYHFPEIAECFPRYIGMSENFIQDLREPGFSCTARICEEHSGWCTDSKSYLLEK